MNITDKFPQRLRQYLTEAFGTPVSINKLSGIKADGGCCRVGFSNTSVIVKQMAEPQEYHFYHECTQLLQEFKNHIPLLYWSWEDAPDYWIVMEDVQKPFPRERWYADPQLLEALYTFHHEMWGKSLPLTSRYVPKWEDELTYSVLELVSDQTGNQLEPLLSELQKQSQVIFKPRCWINADTNPTNWGIRDDGTIVLFDWERISCGSPSIDLSITIPGLGTPDSSVEALIARRYLELWSRTAPDFPLTEQELLQEIKLAKFWSIVEFLGNNRSVPEQDTRRDLITKFIERTYALSKFK